MLKIGIIVGSTRPGRKAAAVAKWAYGILQSRKDADFEIVDIEDYKLPLLDEPMPPSMGQYSKAHTKTWAAKIDSFDAFIFVTPEYNHGTSGVLKNAIDFLFREWNDKAAGFIGYGGAGRCPCGGKSQASDGRAQGRARTYSGDAFAIYRLRELHDLQTEPTASSSGRECNGQRGDRLGRRA